jgi:hypothetical protein
VKKPNSNVSFSRFNFLYGEEKLLLTDAIDGKLKYFGI